MQITSLSQIRWLGGSPCSGKSTITALLAEHHDIDVYHVDDALYQRPERIDAKYHPALANWMAASCDERWLISMDQLLADAVACYTEHFGMILEDLQEMANDRIVIAEGTALLPDLVAGLGIEHSKALWMTPTPAFQKKHYRRRPWVSGMLAECSDPEKAFDNWMERDTRFARQITNQAASHGFTVFSNDGKTTIDTSVDRVADYLDLR